MNANTETRRRIGGARTVLVAGASSAVSTAPVFLMASLATLVRQDFAFGPADLGLAVTCFFLASALAAIPGGRVTERIGARRAMLGSAAIGAVAAIGIATTAHSLPTLVVWLVVAGFGNGVAQPAGNLAITRGVRPQRLGMAFGVKQSAIPTATLAAGVVVPLIGLTVGWRWAFVGVACGAIAVAAAMPRDPLRSPPTTVRRSLRRGRTWRALVVLAFATGCGAAVANSLASFYVDSAVDAGVPVGLAGGLLAMGSLAVIVVRVAIGWRIDRTSWDHLRVVQVLIVTGTAGYVGLVFSEHSVALIAGTLLAFMAGWGWPGLFNLAVVRLNPDAPAAATSITQTGVFIGGLIGPVVFGAIVQVGSFDLAWTFAAVLNIGVVVAVEVARRMVRSMTPDTAEET